MMFDRRANLKCKFGSRKFWAWAEGYYVSSVSLSETAIVKCIREQESVGIARDGLSVKKCEGPFGKR